MAGATQRFYPAGVGLMRSKTLLALMFFLIILSAGCVHSKRVVRPGRTKGRAKAEKKREAWEDFFIYFAEKDPHQTVPARSFPIYRMRADRSVMSIAKFGGQIIYSQRGCSFDGDGKRVAWTELSGSNHVAVMNSDGTGKVIIKEGVESSQPALSHEGATVAFVIVHEFGTEHMNENIALAHFGATTGAVEAQNPYGESSASSPSYDLFDKRIYLDAEIHENRDIFSFDAITGKGVIRLTADRYNNSQPCVTPDGKKVVFASDRSGKWDIYLIANKGISVPDVVEDWQKQEAADQRNDFFRNQQVFRLTQEGENKDPAISPDGEMIAFSSNRDGNWEIYLMRIDGTEQRRLTFNHVDDLAPSWSPQ